MSKHLLHAFRILLCKMITIKTQNIKKKNKKKPKIIILQKHFKVHLIHIFVLLKNHDTHDT